MMKKKSLNLNDLALEAHCGENVARQKSLTTRGQVNVYFDDLESELVKKIKRYPIVVGCVAWLTNEAVIETLATRDRVSIVVQKEDFLRPDSGSWSGAKLRKSYASMPDGPSSSTSEDMMWGRIVSQLDACHTWTSPPVRWMGNFNTKRDSAFPRMHHKFLVFCDCIQTERIVQCNSTGLMPEEDYETYGLFFAQDESFGAYEFIVAPRAVWTGSFNMTNNATKSLENAVFIQNQVVAKAYYDEWQHVFSLSENIPAKEWDEHKWAPEKFYLGS